MPYNSIIDRTAAGDLIPETVSAEIIQSVVTQSAVLRLGRRMQNIPSAKEKLPVLSALPTAYFVSGDNGLKQTTQMAWGNKYLVAEEIAAIVPIPEAVLADASYDIWAEVRPRIEEAFGAVIDAAALLGTNIPTSWNTNFGGAGILGAMPSAHKVDLSTQEAAGQDLYDVLLGDGGVFSLVEADGYAVNGSIAAISMKGKLRGLREKVYSGAGGLVAAGTPMFTTSMQDAARFQLAGTPIEFPENGSMVAATVLDISGDFRNLLYAFRQDITYKVLTEAVIQDGSGAIVYNLAQQDMVALRAVLRLGMALPNPITLAQPTAADRFPFAALVP